MGGIAAIFDWSGAPVEAAAVAAMTAAMDYRGPDGIAHWTGDGAALGACLMHTATEAREAAQPLSNADGSLVLVFDGYVANRAALRRKLEERGARLRNRSDAELVLHAFAAWGDDCAAHIDGEFAYIIRDERRKSVHCARDHAGLRPLFYLRDKRRLVLASDLAAIRAAAARELEPNAAVLVQLAAGQYHWREETVWSVVERVMPAHAMRFDGQGQQERRYWDLPEPYSIRHSSDAEYAEHYREVLFESVRQASRCDRPLGIEVSGGLDSTAVFAVADQLAGNGRLGAPGLAGFALEGPRGSAADETAFTQAAEDHVGRTIHRQPLHVPSFDWLQSQARRDADIPYFPNSVMAAEMYRSMARQGHRVVLTGLGGDEWLNGKPSLFRQSLAAQDWPMLRRSFDAVAEAYGNARALRALCRFGLLPWLAGPFRRKLRHESNPAPDVPWLSSSGQEMLRECAQRQGEEAARNSGRRTETSPCPLPMTMAILEQASRLHAQCGVEGRHPLFSRRFIEFSAATPEAIRLRGNRQKFTHRRALASLLPEQILTRSTKAEFSTVLVSQLRRIENFLRNQPHESIDHLISAKELKGLFTTSTSKDVDIHWQWPLWGTVALISIRSAK